MKDMEKISSHDAPKAIGPYSQGILLRGGERMLFVSGQLPMHPETNEIIQGDIRAMTHQVLDNIQAILLAAGMTLEHVVRSDIFLTDLARDFAAVNEEYAKRVSKVHPPARQTVQVAALPKGASLEISCIAIL
jgi:2-iminobutanoate/2-iminopropanoate deaminase